METIAPTIIFRMGHSFVLLNGRTAVSVTDNLALALRRFNQGSPQIDVVQVRAVPIVTDLSKHQISAVCQWRRGVALGSSGVTHALAPTSIH